MLDGRHGATEKVASSGHGCRFETLGDVAEKVARSRAEGDALRAELGLDD